MNQTMSYRKNSIVAGALLLAAIVTGVVGVSLTNSILASPDALTLVAIHPTRILLGALLFLLMGFCCAGIAIWLYPVLKLHNPAMALGAVGFRMMEGTIFLVSAASTLQLVTLAKEAFHIEMSLVPAYQIAGNVLLHAGDWLGEVAGALAFCLGALLYYIIMIQSRIVPRWLSVWGLIAILSHLVAVILVLFGANSLSPVTLALNLPIFLNEIVLAVWLILKGFDLSQVEVQ